MDDNNTVCRVITPSDLCIIHIIKSFNDFNNMDECLTTSPASNGHIEVIHYLIMSACCMIFLGGCEGSESVQDGVWGQRVKWLRVSEEVAPESRISFRDLGYFACLVMALLQYKGLPFIA